MITGVLTEHLAGPEVVTGCVSAPVVGGPRTA